MHQSKEKMITLRTDTIAGNSKGLMEGAFSVTKMWRASEHSMAHNASPKNYLLT
jgi:hypothetical protein